MNNMSRNALTHVFADGEKESGMVTAEYAVGTCAATGFAGLLVWLFKQEWVMEGLEKIIRAIFKF